MSGQKPNAPQRRLTITDVYVHYIMLRYYFRGPKGYYIRLELVGTRLAH